MGQALLHVRVPLLGQILHCIDIFHHYIVGQQSQSEQELL